MVMATFSRRMALSEPPLPSGHIIKGCIRSIAPDTYRVTVNGPPALSSERSCRRDLIIKLGNELTAARFADGEQRRGEGAPQGGARGGPVVESLPQHTGESEL